jgi:large subunit ribosomal protein L30
MKKIGVVRIRGSMGVRKDIKDTMNILKLYNKNHCIIINNSPNLIGMLRKIKDYVTWGEIEEKTFKELLLKRGKIIGKKNLTEQYIKEKTKLSIDEFVNEFFNFKKTLNDIPGLKSYFRLKPPVKGFERKGIKVPFSMGGVLGYRKEKINDLILRML